MMTAHKHVTYPYPFLTDYLMKIGYHVYPHEMVCGEIDCPHEQNRLVDAVAKKDGKFYAFEYKSSSDYLMRAVKQVENYRQSFDYVIVVAEVPRFDVSVHPTRGVRIRELVKLGAGLWTVTFHSERKLDQKEIAETFKRMSWQAPIEAHQVGTDSNGQLSSNDNMWFWMFYSVLDRRSNASTFIKAKQILMKYQLFKPSDIVAQVQKVGKEKTVEKITSLLKEHNFPLLVDKTKGEQSHTYSILEAALFMSKFNYNFHVLYMHYRKGKNLTEARDSLWRDLKKEIYGVGDRIASQFIRGMVLKADWNFPLNSDHFLEKCRFNMQTASKIRLIKSKLTYVEDLQQFANHHLHGNCGIIAHVLWYLRKRFCSQQHCFECPLYSNCINNQLYSTNQTIKCHVTQLIKPQLQNPHPQNREWIHIKFNHSLPILKKQPVNQAYLTDYITK